MKIQDLSPRWGNIITAGGVGEKAYFAVLCPEHPAAWKNGYVYVHRVTAELVSGRFLEPDEIVHHKDGNRQNNYPDNLEIMKRWKHSAHHNSTGRTMDSFVCNNCGLK